MQASPQRVNGRIQPRQTTAGWIALIVFGLLAAIGAFIAIGIVGGYLALSRDLANPSDLANLQFAQESIVYDRTGKVELARFGTAHRDVVEFDEIPRILIDATTAVEDKSFWTNSGFDPAAIVAAGIDSLRGNARGASTITQQLVRQRLLEPELVQAPGRQAERKLKEIIQSIRLTKAYPGDEGKQRIITAYLNQNYYGNNSYGVKAAARTYFGKELDKLTLAEAAILAGIPQSPTGFDLVRNAETGGDGRLTVPADSPIVQRRNRILDLLAQGRTPLSGDQYTAADFQAAKEEPVVLAAQTGVQWTAPHFVWAVREELTRQLCGPDTETCAKLDEGGLRITTTLDTRLQAIAEKWVKAAALVPKEKDPRKAAKDLGLTYASWMDRLKNKDLHNGALVALDYETGELVAYVGSADYYAEKGSKAFQPKFDVAGDGLRQPGSAFKPFNYLTGIDSGQFTAATMFMDVGTDFGNYTPSDADNLERGPVRLRSALQFSLNIPSVKAVAVNGPDKVFARAQDFGLRFQGDRTKAGLALALGVEEVRPVDLVTGYGTIANAGRFVEHTTILRVVGSDGKDVIPPHKAQPRQVAQPGAAAIVTDILAGNTNPSINPFWGKFAITNGNQRRPATLKTGTNNDAKDLNAYGFIAPPTASGRKAGEYALAVGAWNGNSDNSLVSTPQQPLFSIDVTTFVWQGFMNEATRRWGVNDFKVPDTLVTAQVDPWTGLLPAPGGRSVRELFLPNTAPTRAVGSSGGVCGAAVLQEAGFESRFSKWMTADQDWIRRAQRGPGTRGGPDRTRTAYFYNNSYTPYGKSWGPLLNGAGCQSPSPSPSCIPLPTPDANGVVPSFTLPSPSGSGPFALPCPPSSAAPSPSASAEPTPPPPTPPPTPGPTPPPTPGPPSPSPGPSANAASAPPP